MNMFKKETRFKSLISMTLVMLMVLPTNVFASTIKKEQPVTDPTTLELISTFPSFKESLDKYTNGKLLSSNEIYIKYTPKSTFDSKKTYTNATDIEKDSTIGEYTNATDIEKDFTISEHTKQEYENEIAQSSAKSLLVQLNAIGGQEEVPCSWLSMTLQVYAGTVANEYMAYNFCSWKTVPLFTFEDATGISFSSGLIATQDATSRRATFNYNVSPDIDRTDSLSVYLNPGSANGVMAKFNLAKNTASPTYSNGLYYNTMISTGVKYSGPGTTSGWITGNYLHKQVSLGSINMDSDGVPSVSLSVSSDSHQASVYVSK